MSASSKSWLALCLLLVAAVSGCSSVVSVDRTKIRDDLFDVPPDAGTADEDDAGE